MFVTGVVRTLDLSRFNILDGLLTIVAVGVVGVGVGLLTIVAVGVVGVWIGLLIIVAAEVIPRATEEVGLVGVGIGLLIIVAAEEVGVGDEAGGAGLAFENGHKPAPCCTCFEESVRSVISTEDSLLFVFSSATSNPLGVSLAWLTLKKTALKLLS